MDSFEYYGDAVVSLHVRFVVHSTRWTVFHLTKPFLRLKQTKVVRNFPFVLLITMKTAARVKRLKVKLVISGTFAVKGQERNKFSTSHNNNSLSPGRRVECVAVALKEREPTGAFRRFIVKPKRTTPLLIACRIILNFKMPNIFVEIA